MNAESSDVKPQDPQYEASISKDKSAEHRTDPTVMNLDPTSNEAIKPSKLDMSVTRLIEKSDQSAGKLVNLLVKHFPGFRDEANFDGRQVRFLKRAQILVADLWCAFNGTGYGEFHDIGHLTMFAGESFARMHWFTACLGSDDRCGSNLTEVEQIIVFHKCYTRSVCSCTAHRWTTQLGH